MRLDPLAPRLPRKFGPYTLFDIIGKGGMAEIFLACARTDLGGQRLCVVKQIIPAFSEHPHFAEMLIHEAKLAARLDHAHIVQVMDLGRAGEALYIAMEYVEGFDLNELLRRCTKAKIPLPFEFALLVVSDVLKALDYAHRRTDDSGAPLGIVHRDVSPSNVLISFEGQSKLCDFGIAHANETVSASTPAGGVPLRDALQGKAGYMSPEHARGEALDARADVFAAGILLWELVAGRRMYRQEGDRGSLLEQARRGAAPPLPPRQLPDEAEIRRITTKALATDRAGRYASSAAMLRDLEAYVASTQQVASPLRLGEWLTSSFGTGMVTERRMRQRGAEALDRGPAVVITPIPPPVADAPPPPRIAPMKAPPALEEPAASVAPAAARSAAPLAAKRGRWIVLAAILLVAGVLALLGRR